MSYGEEHIDEVLFDYLEGNLADIELAEIEKELTVNNALKDELDLWEATKVKEKFYDTKQLESVILNETKSSFSILQYLNIALIISMVFIVGIQKFELSSDQITIDAQTENNDSSIVEFNKVNIIKPSLITEINAINLPDIKPDNISTSNIYSNVNPIDNIPVKGSFIHEMHIDIPSKPNIPKISYHTLKSKKKKHKSAKKEKQRNKPASTFKKGKVPYVVPIDAKNFY